MLILSSFSFFKSTNIFDNYRIEAKILRRAENWGFFSLSAMIWCFFLFYNESQMMSFFCLLKYYKRNSFFHSPSLTSFTSHTQIYVGFIYVYRILCVGICMSVTCHKTSFFTLSSCNKTKRNLQVSMHQQTHIFSIPFSSFEVETYTKYIFWFITCLLSPGVWFCRVS